MTNVGKRLTRFFHALAKADAETSRRMARSMAEFERVRLVIP